MFKSTKILKAFIGMNDRKPGFDGYCAAGNASSIFECFPVGDELIDINAMAIERYDSDSIKNTPYTSDSDDRIEYSKRVVNLCNRHDAGLKVFITPLYSRLLDDICSDSDLVNSLNMFKKRACDITGYYDF